MDKRVYLEVFVEPASCSCSYELLRKSLEKICKYIEEKYNVEVEWFIMQVNTKRAFDLGVTMVNTVVLNDKIILEGFSTYDQVLKAVEREVENFVKTKIV